MTYKKITHTFDLRNDQLDWLDQIVEKYGLPDEEKALRILLDYAIQDGDKDLIFSDENMRCRYCG